MADTYQQAIARMDTGETKARRWSFTTDGPPLLLVAMLFAGLLGLWLAPGSLGVLAAMLIAALLLTLMVDFPRWGGFLLQPSRVGESHDVPLAQRLDEARARQIEQDRWR